MNEQGIWSDAAGGFIETGIYGDDDAAARLESWRAEGEDDAEIKAVCPDHEEQPADSCQDCYAEN